MAEYFESTGCQCPAIMRSETICSFVNGHISIDFNTGKWKNRTLFRDHPDFDFNNQQLYIFKPSELFEKAADSFVMDGSRGKDNLACSYQLYDELDKFKEFDDFDGIKNGYFNTSDSFACTYNPQMAKGGLIESNDSISIYSSRMPLQYETVKSYTNASFHHNFSVIDNPGLYCVNVTTYKTFDNPVIKFWDQTPFSSKFPQLSFPVYEYICWTFIASVFLIGFGVCDALYDPSAVVLSLVAVCLCKNGFDVLSLYFKAREMLVLQILISGVIGTISMFVLLMTTCSSIKEEAFSLLCPFALAKVYSFIHMCIDRFSDTSRFGYFVFGSIMNNMVIFKVEGDPNFYVLLYFKFFLLSLFVLSLYSKLQGSEWIKIILIIGLAFYILICLLIELSFFTRESQLVDIFYRDFMVLVYTRLDELLIIAYICGNVLWRTFRKHYQCESKFRITETS